MADDSANGTIQVTFKRTTNRDGLARSIIFEWLRPPETVEISKSESGSMYLFAEFVAAIQTSHGLPFDPIAAKGDKAVALAAYQAWLDMDEQVAVRLHEELKAFNVVTDPALMPEAPPKAKKKTGNDDTP